MRIEIIIFFVLLAIILLFQVAKGHSVKKQDKADKVSGKMKELLALKNPWFIVIVVIGYILLLMTVSVVFPYFWELLWKNQALFWTTTIGILIGIGLLLIPRRLSTLGIPIGIILIVVLLIGIGKNAITTWDAYEDNKTTTATKIEIDGFDMEIHTVWAPVGKRSLSIVMEPGMCIGWNSTHRDDKWNYNTYINSELYKVGHQRSVKTVEFSSVTQSPVNVTYAMYPKPCNKNG